MRTVKDSFEACFRVLERGEAVAIFPEGITHDDPQLKAVKTGAARMALELEDRHGGNLGLLILPVGLTFSAKEIYRSRALVHFGEPIRVTDFLADYRENRHAGIQRLNGEIQRRIQALILHLPHLERGCIVEAVKRLYLDRLQVGTRVIHEPAPPQAGELLLTQTIARAVDLSFAEHPARASEFVRKLNHYEGRMKRLHLSDELLAEFPDRKRWVWRSLGWAALALAGAPIALYGWIHRWLPALLVEGIVRRTARPTDKTQVSTATVLGGLVVFTGFYAGCAAVFYAFFGMPATAWYALSLPLSSLLAYHYVRHLRRFGASLKALAVVLRLPGAARRLLAARAELIALIEAERRDLEPPHRSSADETRPERKGMVVNEGKAQV
jgi:hypothetical protein